MKPPNITSSQEWQRFFVGVVIGAIISWLLYFYMHGVMQEKQILLIAKQKDTIAELTRNLEIWKKDYELLNEDIEKKIKIQDITVTIENYKTYKLDLLSVIEAQKGIRNDLSSLITKDLETVYKGKLLIKKTIENKIIEINDKKYTFEVSEMMFYSTLILEVKIKRV